MTSKITNLCHLSGTILHSIAKHLHHHRLPYYYYLRKQRKKLCTHKTKQNTMPNFLLTSKRKTEKKHTHTHTHTNTQSEEEEENNNDNNK